MKLFKIFNRKSLSQECQRKFSSLYTWGDYQAGLGWGQESRKPIFETYGTPKKVMENVKQVSMGRDHSALITMDGQLYTSGCGRHYQLGNGSYSKKSAQFQQVEFFKGIKVKQVVCDDSYTVVLTESGDVYHVGQYYGGYFNRFIRTPQQLNIPEKVNSIACGKQYGFAITQDNNTYSWGIFDKGCQGDTDYHFKREPELNFRFQELKHKKHIVPIQIKIHGYSTMVLMSNGKLWSCGENNCGQLALREHEGWRTDQFNHFLKPINDINIKHSEVKQFEIGQNCSVILSKKGEVFYSGFNDKWWMVQDTRVNNAVSIAVRDDCYYVLENDGTVMISHPEDCLDSTNQRHIFAINKVQTTIKTLFDNQMPSLLGAKYGTSFAII